MTTSKPTPGKTHAPGVKCIVSVALSEDRARSLEIAQEISNIFGFRKTVKHIMQADNGRIVRLLAVVTDHCPICGASTEEYLIPPGSIIWHVESADNMGLFQSDWAIHTARTAIFTQSSLIPLSDEDLEIEIAAETATGDATDLHVSETLVKEATQVREQNPY